MKARKQWVFLALLVVAAMAITAYVGTSGRDVAVLEVSVSPQPARIGHVSMVIGSTVPLSSVFVRTPDRDATPGSKDGNRHLFNYYVSPYDDLGLKKVEVYATDIHGNDVYAESSLYVEYFAGGALYNDIIFYSFEWVPDGRIVQLVQGEMNIIFESFQGRENDADSVQGFFNLVLKMAERGANATIFDATTDGNGWVRCRDSENRDVPVEVCTNAAEKPSFILRHPAYPTTQFFVHNSTIELHPKRGEVEKAAKAMEELLNDHFVTVPAQNLTEGIQAQ